MNISFIGLGEVGSTYSMGLAKAEATVKGYDLKFHDPAEKDKFLPCAEAGVKLVGSPQELIEGSDIIIAVTSCTQAMETAVMYKPFLKKNQRYVELNSTVPELVNEVCKFLGDSCTFVDGATLCSPSQFGVATPIVMSGKYGKQTADDLNAYGMNIRHLGNEIGQASAYKVIRSIFTKGLEAILVESITAARNYGVADEIFESIVEFVAGEPTDITFALMIQTNVIHAKRRGDEIAEIAVMLKNAGLENTMSEAATKKLYWLASLGLKEKFNGKKADTMYDAVDAMRACQKSIK
jgi:3-hydroxyisobutyrate dehydrogenase-like beta-hydroxyacid dehydrogenase